MCAVDWVVKLAPQLTGRAQQAYAAMSTENVGDYSKVNEAILRRYDICEETYHQRFRAAHRKEGEAYIELATHLTDLFKKWTVKCDSVSAVAEKVTIEQLQNTMSSDVQVWLRERKPKTCAEAGRLADDYVLARQHSHGGTPRSEPKKRDTTPAEDGCKCHSCGQEGHLALTCPKKTEPPKEPTPGISTSVNARKCYNCQQKGHIAHDCPSAYFCGSETLGGWEWECSGSWGGGGGGGSGAEWRREDGSVEAGKVEVNGSTVEGVSVHRIGIVEGTRVPDIMLDTGCLQTIVH